MKNIITITIIMLVSICFADVKMKEFETEKEAITYMYEITKAAIPGNKTAIWNTHRILAVPKWINSSGKYINVRYVLYWIED